MFQLKSPSQLVVRMNISHFCYSHNNSKDFPFKLKCKHFLPSRSLQENKLRVLLKVSQ